MTSSTQKADALDNIDAVIPEKSPFYMGPGMVIRGDLEFFSEDPDARLVILGQFFGNIRTNAILQVAPGAIIHASELIDAGQVVVSGKITGNKVTVRTNMLAINPTGNVHVDVLCLPPGGLENSRGSVLNARLDMDEKHFKETSDAPQQVETKDGNTAIPVVAMSPVRPIPFAVVSRIESRPLLSENVVFSSTASDAHGEKHSPDLPGVTSPKSSSIASTIMSGEGAFNA